MKKISVFLILILCLSCIRIFAQPTVQLVQVVVIPDQTDWQYKTGEKVRFSINAFYKGHPLKGVKAFYQYGLESMGAMKKDSILLNGEDVVINAATLKEPGFLRCNVSLRFKGQKYDGMATAGFSIDELKPTITRPEDFISFWDQAKSELSKIPLDAKIRLIPESSTQNANVYEVNIQNWGFAGPSRLYGILSVPKKEGKYPALLVVPGAGVRGMPTESDPMTEKGVIVLKIDIHGMPVTLPTEVYDGLNMGGLRMYWNYNVDHKDRYYYKRAFLACVRANDFLTQLPQFDGSNLVVTGRSQGGALSIVTASLDSRVKALFCGYPALCDLTGYLYGRAGGWPPLVHEKAGGMYHNKNKETLATLPYYDVVNFARELKVPGLYSWGFNDIIVPPTSMQVAYNVITSPKKLLLYPESGHWQYPELAAQRDAWLLDRLWGKAIELSE